MFGHRYFSLRYWGTRYWGPRKTSNVVTVYGTAVGASSARGVVPAVEQRTVGPRHVHFGPVHLPVPSVVRVAGMARGSAVARAASWSIAHVSGSAAGTGTAQTPAVSLRIGYLEFDGGLKHGRRNGESRSFHNDESRSFLNGDDAPEMRRAA